MGHLDAAPAVLRAGVFGAYPVGLRKEWTWEQQELPATLPPNVAVAAALCTHAVNAGLPWISNRCALFLPPPKSINKCALIEEMAE